MVEESAIGEEFQDASGHKESVLPALPQASAISLPVTEDRVREWSEALDTSS